MYIERPCLKKRKTEKKEKEEEEEKTRKKERKRKNSAPLSVREHLPHPHSVPMLLGPSLTFICFSKHVFVELLVCGREKQAHRVSTL